MPLKIEDLIPDPQIPITVTEDKSAQYALSLMIEHEFSQLPVVDERRKLKGMLTSDSLLRTVSHFKAVPKELTVSHALIKARPYRREDDATELLKSLRDNNAVPIVDRQDTLEAIITSYDVAEHFRQKTEDITYAEDIEATLKDIIEGSHKDDRGELNINALEQSIQAITSSGGELKNKFKGALLSYINKTTGKNPIPDNKTLDEVFIKYLAQPTRQRTFEELTLHDFIQMFSNLWEQHSTGFGELNWDAISHLLHDVRQTRNAIAHFREVTPQQRKQLRFCADFLERHRPSPTISESSSNDFIPSNFISRDLIRDYLNINVPLTEERTSKDFLTNVGKYIFRLRNEQTNQASIQQEKIETSSLLSLDEELDEKDSRYAPLAIYLQAQDKDKITHTFNQIEAIIGDELPPSAYKNRSWWANDSVGHVQSIQWLEAGWRVSSVNMSAERVVFSKMGDRQSAYIDFFCKLQDKLSSIEALNVEPKLNPQGKSWAEFAISPGDSQEEKPPRIVFSFARRSRFRMEVYINESDRGQTKQVFDRLHRQEEDIETEFGAPLSWERLNGGHASRIAYYRIDSSITNEVGKLEEIQQWAVETLPKFYSALSDRFIDA